MASASCPAPGSWPSPISATDAVRGRRALSVCAFAGDEVWWAEGRPDERGRVTVCARAVDGSGPVREVLPAPHNARTRVHEYGGRSFLPVPRDVGDPAAGFDLVFVDFADQRLYRLSDGDRFAPLVPEPDRPLGLRWADFELDGIRNRLLAVREQHDGDGTYRTVRRSVVAIPLDGSAASDPAAVVEFASDADFYAAPRLDPSGRRLVYLSWNHPHMPWDATELHLMHLDAADPAARDVVIAGGNRVSVVDPGFLTTGARAGQVLAVADDDGWWHPVAIEPDGEPGGGRAGDPAAGRAVEPAVRGRSWLSSDDAEFGFPMWQLGLRHWAELPDGALVTVRDGAPGILGAGGIFAPLHGSWSVCTDLHADRGGRIALVAGGPTVTTRVCVLHPRDSGWHATDLRVAAEPEHDVPEALRPRPRQVTIDGVHAVVYPPTHPEFTAAPGSAPYLMVVHGGPTGQFSQAASATTAFFTSRGIGVVGLDYAGSTGYGRAYRERLHHAWGRVDVTDAVTVARALVADGTAAPGAVVIQGGSAGGWTVLSALTAPPELIGTGSIGTDSPFAAGISLFGVADARALADGTHDFEARYTDSLLGPDPDAWFAASPLAHIDRLRTPVLLLQGGNDPIVTPDQAEAFRAACVARGVPHALVVFPEEGHGFRTAAAQITTLQAQLSFLGQILGFATPGVPHVDLAPPGSRA